MACNCKAGRKAKNIIDLVNEDVEEYKDNKWKEYSIMALDYTIGFTKMFLACIGIILVSPFVTAFVLFEFVTKGAVTIKVPQALREK